MICYSHDADKLRRVKQAFGEYLDQRGYHDEAGLTLLAAEDFSSSILSFKKALNVQMILSVAKIIKISG